jgi:hypothetical protein
MGAVDVPTIGTHGRIALTGCRMIAQKHVAGQTAGFPANLLRVVT